MKQRDLFKKIFSFFIRVFLSLGLLWFIFSRIDMDKTVEVLVSSDPVYIFYAYIIFLLINFFLLLRWFIFIKALEVEVSVRTIVRYFFIGLFGNLFLPSSIGGDFIKIYGVCKETNKKARAVASVLLDRLSGFAAIVIVSVFSFILGNEYIDDKMLIFPIIVIAFVSLSIVLVLFNKMIYSFVCRIFNKLPKIKNGLMQMHYDIALLRGKKIEGVKAILLSCVSQVTYVFTFYLCSKALNQDISIVYFLIFVPLICVASSVPSIGGLGVREAGAAYFFSKVGMDPGIAVSLSLISFIFMVTVGLLGGIIYVFTISSGRVQLNVSDAIV